MDFDSIGISVPKILLPKDTGHKNFMNKWSVVACDQYTSKREYWQHVEKLVGKNPSTLRIMLPEIYLEDKDAEERIRQINKTMHSYLKDVLEEKGAGFVYVERTTPHGTRQGLVVALDLEHYDYNKGSQTLIRATEGTVVERLPPRIKVRKDAPLELPHIMVLIDDPKKTVIEPLAKAKLTKLYDFDLMMHGGHITGQLVSAKDNKELLTRINAAIAALALPKYGKRPLLFAMGDGNHSLATAKAVWEEKKKGLKASELKGHPARYALVELVNVHNDALRFEPIHRVIFNTDENVFDEMKKFFGEFEYVETKLLEKPKSREGHSIPFVMGTAGKPRYGMITIKKPKYNLEVGSLQSFIDDYLKGHKVSKVDYIHGDEDVIELGSKQGNIGFLLPSMPKSELFKTVILDGVLPRKTFSMGEADEKRYYLECRKIA